MADHKDQNKVFDIHADAYSEGIDETLRKYGTDHDFFTAHKSRLILEAMARMGKAPSDMSLMDVGCGVGKIHPYLHDDFASITGVDLSEPSIKVARAQNPGTSYLSYDGDTLPADDNSVDMTLTICVMHHVPVAQWPDFSREMMRVLRPGGVAMVIEHNPYNPVTLRIVNTCPLDVDATLLPARKTRALFRGAGAVDVKSRSVLSVPPKNAALQKVDTWLGHLPFGAQYYMTARKADAGAP